MTLCVASAPVDQFSFTPTRRVNCRGRWVELLPHLAPHHGGLSAVVPQLGEQLTARENFEVEIASFDGAPAVPLHRMGGHLQVSQWPSNRLAWLRDRKLRSLFSDLLQGADGVHIHGLWSSHAAVSAYTSRALRKPYIVSAHGMLEPWALAHKGWKKRLYSSIVEHKTLAGAKCLHALTLAEAKDYRRFGCIAPIAVIPNAVDVPERIDTSVFLQAFPQLQGQRIILFLGRLHFKKGVDTLVQAWASLASRFPDTTLVLAGPDCNGTQAAHEAVLVSSGLGNRVVFTGMLGAEMKWSALACASCFILPSRSEGFSVAVLEAMAAGLPVIVSTRCHFPEVARSGAGFVIEPTQKQVRDALEEVLMRPNEANTEMGMQGRRLVQSQFSWPVVAQQMAELYAWAQGGTRPQSFTFIEGKL